MVRTVITLLAILPLAAAAETQHQPYAGLERRAVKSLSDREIEDLRAGRGMGTALPAELNGYPGPVHVLELADALNLDAEQRARTRALFEAMKAEAVPLGERLIEQEMALDSAFSRRTITAQALREMTAAIGATRASLRAAHLRYHLLQIDVLSPDQIARYASLRGYEEAAPHGQGGHGPARRHHK
jgi:Spy/CpxP family protein refolding chaperone